MQVTLVCRLRRRDWGPRGMQSNGVCRLRHQDWGRRGMQSTWVCRLRRRDWGPPGMQSTVRPLRTTQFCSDPPDPLKIHYFFLRPSLFFFKSLYFFSSPSIFFISGIHYFFFKTPTIFFKTLGSHRYEGPLFFLVTLFCFKYDWGRNPLLRVRIFILLALRVRFWGFVLLRFNP